MLATMSASAQDTVRRTVPDSSYFYDFWFNYTADQTMGGIQGMGFVTTKVSGIFFNVDDGVELPVYGIAASMKTLDPDMYIYHAFGMCDSSGYYATLAEMCDTGAVDQAYEYWGIYKWVDDSLELASPRLKFNIKTMPVTYYWDMAFRTPMSDSAFWPLPMYEMYFDEPQVVTDSFCLAMSNRIRTDKPYGMPCTYLTWPIFWNVVGFFDCGFYSPQHFVWHEFLPNGESKWFHDRRTRRQFLIFPILEPDRLGNHCQEDTTGGGGVTPGDTTGVGISAQQRLLWNMSVVLPNPAADEARVVCGVPLTTVEAFDDAGRLVATRRVDGHEVTFDVSAWPSGVYLLRLTTALGSVTKRLVVSR